MYVLYKVEVSLFDRTKKINSRCDTDQNDDKDITYQEQKNSHPSFGLGEESTVKAFYLQRRRVEPWSSEMT